MQEISSEAKAAGMQEPEKAVEEMTEEERKAFRASFDPDSMGFDGAEGVEEEEDNDGEQTADQQADNQD